MKKQNIKLSKCLDTLDLMRDEFLRIRACPGVNTEVVGLCNRALANVERNVPILVENERVINKLRDIRHHLRSIYETLEE